MEVDRYLHEISARVRRWRSEDRLTLQQVAHRSGVAASTIQKVESQQMVPTITVLFKIARGLGRNPVELIDEIEHEADLVVRRGAADSDEQVVHLTGELPAAQLSGWRVVLAPGEHGQAASPSAGGELLLISERGRLEVVRGEETFSLEPGDCLHSKSEEGISWRALGDVPVRFTLVKVGPNSAGPRIHPRSEEASAPAAPKARAPGGPSSVPS